MSINYSKKIYTAVRNYLSETERCLCDPRYGILCAFRDSGSVYLGILMIQINCHRYSMDFIARLLYHIDMKDRETRNALSLFISEVNSTLPEGHFFLDYGDGELRFKLHYDTVNEDVPTRILDRGTSYPITVFRQFEKGIKGILIRHMTAEEALAVCCPPDLSCKRWADMV